jgi:hypothetical protein
MQACLDRRQVRWLKEAATGTGIDRHISTLRCWRGAAVVLCLLPERLPSMCSLQLQQNHCVCRAMCDS